jgi:integrase
MEYCYTSALKYFEPIHYAKFREIKTDTLQKYVNECPHGRKTKENMRSLVTSMYKYAMSKDLVDRNYASYIKLPPKNKRKDKKIFDKDDINKLWEAYGAGNGISAYILIMIYTGMRYGDLASVLTKNIHIDEQ